VTKVRAEASALFRHYGAVEIIVKFIEHDAVEFRILMHLFGDKNLTVGSDP